MASAGDRLCGREAKLKHRGVKTVLWQIAALALCAVMMGVGVNQLRSDGLTLVGEPAALASLGPVEAGEAEIDLAEARRLFGSPGVLFLDARPASQYAQGHIRGALNLAWPQAETEFIQIADRLDAARMIIAYCDGEACRLSHELARFLADMGFGDIRVLVNGWSLWREGDLPIETEASQNG